jgi:hypothetical protein
MIYRKNACPFQELSNLKKCMKSSVCSVNTNFSLDQPSWRTPPPQSNADDKNESLKKSAFRPLHSQYTKSRFLKTTRVKVDKKKNFDGISKLNLYAPKLRSDCVIF